MIDRRHVKLLIIGAGPAGYTAAIYAARANLSPLLIQGMQPGGQLSITTDVENYPGFADVIQGPWLMEQMAGQAEACGAELMFDIVTEVALDDRPMRAVLDSGSVISFNSLIISTGATARWLGLKSEQRFMGHGVSACATCDGFFFRGKDVAVVGGGNTAAEEALYLSQMCRTVHLVHRRSEMRAEKVLQDRVLANEKIVPHWNRTIGEIVGQSEPLSVTGVRLASTAGASDEDVSVDGVFIAIGHDPATGLFKGEVEMDRDGYIVTQHDSTATNVEGVFAAGDVQDKIYRQAVTAAGTGCMAALEAEKYLAGHS